MSNKTNNKPVINQKNESKPIIIKSPYHKNVDQIPSQKRNKAQKESGENNVVGKQNFDIRSLRD